MRLPACSLLFSLGLSALPASAQQPETDVSPAVREQNAPPAIRQRLQQLRAEVVAKRLTFSVGYTTAFDRPPAHRTGLDLLPPEQLKAEAEEQDKIADKVLAKERQAIIAHEKKAQAAGQPLLPETTLQASLPAASTGHFDWTTLGKVTGVRDQGGCGSCWAFASVAALESSLLIREGRNVDLSEQFVLDASLAGSCDGGTTPEAFTVMMLEGVPKESNDPYKAHEGHVAVNPLNNYRALIWGFAGSPFHASVADLKAELLLHGPLTTCIRVTDLFTVYSGGVFNEHAAGSTNHVVTLVGWDDGKQAWRIKNSWGKNWGEQGFAWVAYGSNSIGFGSTWVEGICSLFPLPPELREWIEKSQKLAAEVEKEARAAAEKAKQALAKARAEAERARVAAAHAAQQAADTAKQAAQTAEAVAQCEKAVTEGAARMAAKEVQDRLEGDLKNARAAARQAQKAADAAKHAAADAAKDVEDTANDVAKAVSGKVSVPRPKLPKW